MPSTRVLSSLRWIHDGRGRISSARGVTIVEVLVALTFMAIVTVGVTGLAIAILTGNSKSTDVGAASNYAQDCLEAIRNTAYGSIATSSCTRVLPSKFSRSVTIQDNTPVNGVKRVLVTISWAGGRITKETLVTQ